MKIENKKESDLTWSDVVRIPSLASLLNQRKSLKKRFVPIYKWVRDLPFEAKLSKGDYYEDLAYITTYKRGSCSQKHYLLGVICESLGASVRYLTYPFYWNELDVAYPDFVRKLARKVRLQYHLAIEIHIDGQDFFLDATWDPPLEKAEFPINRIDDELINTNIAVVPCGKCIINTDALEREEFIAATNKTRGKISREEIKFYSALNVWFEELRQK